MRRSMRRDILITKPPPAPPRKKQKKKKPKNPERRCMELKMLYDRYLKQMNTLHRHHIFARHVGVKEATARRWMYGYPPSELNIWLIARYFAQRTNIDDRIIHKEISEALANWRAK